MLTRKQKLAAKIVLRMHIIAGVILDAADIIEDKIVIPDE